MRRFFQIMGAVLWPWGGLLLVVYAAGMLLAVYGWSSKKMAETTAFGLAVLLTGVTGMVLRGLTERMIGVRWRKHKDIVTSKTRITARLLEHFCACSAQVALFKELRPTGVRISYCTVLQALNNGLDVWWLGTCIFVGDTRMDFDAAHAEAERLHEENNEQSEKACTADCEEAWARCAPRNDKQQYDRDVRTAEYRRNMDLEDNKYFFAVKVAEAFIKCMEKNDEIAKS